jgi:hypothetical protein
MNSMAAQLVAEDLFKLKSVILTDRRAISLLISFIKRIYRALSQSNKVVLYIALNDEEYFRVAANLQKENIRFMVKTHSENRGTSLSTVRSRTYEIFVKKEDEHKAREAIQYSS